MYTISNIFILMKIWVVQSNKRPTIYHKQSNQVTFNPHRTEEFSSAQQAKRFELFHQQFKKNAVSPHRASSSMFVGHSEAVAVKFCLLLSTRDLYRSDLWQTTTVPPWFGFTGVLLLLLPIRVPIIFDTENFRVFWVGCIDRHSLRRASKDE